jgi:hypothetical protein
MTNVPDELVPGRVEHVVQRDRQLDHAKAGADVTPGLRTGVDQELPHLCRKRRQISTLEPLEIGGRMYPGKEAH